MILPTMGALRIAIDYRPALLGRSGIPRSVRELAAALARHTDVDLRLFAHSASGARAAAAVPESARLCRLPIPGRSLHVLARVGLDAARLSHGADVFHWTDYVHPPVRERTPVVLTLHDCASVVEPSFHGENARTLTVRTRAAIERARLVVCPTAATAADAREYFGVDEARLRVVPFGADHVAVRDTAADRSRGPIVMLGTIEPRKNHTRALAAWQALGESRPELVVVGARGWSCEASVSALDAAVRAGGCRWLRRADDAVVADLLERAAAVLYPSLAEGFGFPPLEALAHGAPVVAGDTPALREVLGDHALFCDPRDVDSIRDALVCALSPAARTPARAADGRSHAARYRWSDCAREYARIYAEAAA